MFSTCPPLAPQKGHYHSAVVKVLTLHSASCGTLGDISLLPICMEVQVDTKGGVGSHCWQQR